MLKMWINNQHDIQQRLSCCSRRWCGCGVPALEMLFPNAVKHRLTVYLSTQLCTQQKASGHLAMKRVCLLWRWSQTMPQHHRHYLMNPSCGTLLAKVKDLITSKCFTKNHYSIDVCLLHHLQLQLRLLESNSLWWTFSTQAPGAISSILSSPPHT